MTEYHRPSGLNNKKLFLTVLDARNSKIKVLAHPVSGENLLPGSQMAVFSLYPHMAEGARKLSRVSLIRALIPFMRAPPSLLKHFPKAPLTGTITLSIRVSTSEF